MSTQEITVNKKKITPEELEEMKKDKNVRLKEEKPNEYRKLDKLEG